MTVAKFPKGLIDPQNKYQPDSIKSKSDWWGLEYTYKKSLKCWKLAQKDQLKKSIWSAAIVFLTWFFSRNPWHELGSPRWVGMEWPKI